MLKLAKGLNRATLQSFSRRQDPELERGTWNETMAEVDHGWIWEDVRRSYSDIVIAKRFGLQQREKLGSWLVREVPTTFYRSDGIYVSSQLDIVRRQQTSVATRSHLRP